ncbi:hypothetical protein GCM10009555_058420 [Acrocarpospora macrocephala]|uniref:Uncharacterized protein n=1 Tax=Acrocarpospora macrocephala TaxID=150177 RepID=A0A5M3WZQ5_9ACTN|nr:hypothetical protein [Acrocarpospora macrocephala]GES11933.1 hypothetical protein Amac_055300 [Acrocarpospora macrocephala]
MRIELHIEHLVLDGVAPADTASFRRALEAELTRVLAEAGAEALSGPDLGRLGSEPAGRAPRVELPLAPGATADQVGTGVADALGRAVLGEVSR